MKDKQIQLRVTKELHQKIKRLAESRDRSVNKTIIRIIEKEVSSAEEGRK